MTDSADTFRPDWASPPGDTIADLLDERGWSQIELARRLGYSPKHMSLLINGKASITEDTALRLERVLGSSARFWLTREAQYRAECARLHAAGALDGWVSWCDDLPVKELMALGAIPKRKLDPAGKRLVVEDLLRFYRVASPEDWVEQYAAMEVQFRRSNAATSDIGAVSAWLRLGEIEAERLEGPRYDVARFRAALQRIRNLTVHAPEEFERPLHALCCEAGVVLVLVPAIPRARVSGAARWLSPHRPLIQLSLYGKFNDRFWLTFFHEAAHLLYHGKREVFLDELGSKPGGSREEREADDWACNFLIPPTYEPSLHLLTSRESVCAFAQRIGVHPGIVVGRLQHDGVIDHAWMNDVKVRFEFTRDAAAS